MTCTEARDAIEIADLEDLRATGGSPLAAHLTECSECKRFAEIVLRGTEKLSVGTADRARFQLRRIHHITAWSSVAAAAMIVAAVVVNRREPTVQSVRPRLGSLPVVRQVSLEVARGQQATVLTTSDPKVTVIWLSSGEGK